jgi:arylsulfatase A-like enzyme
MAGSRDGSAAETAGHSVTGDPIDASVTPVSATQEPDERPAFGRRVLAHIVLAFAAGGLVFLVEAIDRLRVLRVNLNGAGDAARLAMLLGATVLFVALAAATFGVVWTLADSVRAAFDRRFGERFGRWRALASLLAGAAVVSVIARVVSGLVPWALQFPVYRIIQRIDNRLFSLGLIADYPRVVFTLLLIAAVVAIMALHAWLFSERGPRARAAAIGFSILCLVAVVGGYYADSRVEFTRYEFMFHIPAEVLYSIAALLTLIGIARAFGAPERLAFARPVVACALAAAFLGIGSFAFGAVAMDGSQNVKALFWYRSVIARRVFQLARYATDRDGDGFSASFGAGDPDDSNPNVHPMAPEEPGNGIDDNGIGGDLSVAEFSRGSLYGGVSTVSPPTIVNKAASVRNVLILSIDCLRADHLGTYGYHRPTSPNIDAFAAESLVFEHPYAQGTNTGHSFTSMYRSSYADDIFDDRIPTFAAELGQHGYEAQFINAIRTDAWLNAQRWGKYKSLMEDFDVLHDSGDRFWNAEVLTDQAIAALDAQPRDVPHLTWVHYFDCHRPRKRHAGHDFGRSAAGVFDSNVAYVDQHLGRMFEHLRATGRLDDTIVFIIADHGEAFMEHGAMDHSNKPYENNTLVPLIVHVPGEAAARFGQPVGLIDVGPTALGFAGVPALACYRGVDLRPSALPGGLPRRPIISETPRNLIESSFYSWALVDWPYKVIWDVRSNTTEVFDLALDPGELHSLADRDPGLATRMRQLLGEWIDRETARTGAVGPGDEGLGDDGD